jgi:imidazolonepropionase-like amidohydrolase
LSIVALSMDLYNGTYTEDVGALEVGRFGDLVAVRGNPLGDISLLQGISVVVKGGVVIRAPGS